MEQDSLKTDSIPERPLPDWLIRQKEGLNTYQPEKLLMKEDRSLQISAAVTGLIIILIIISITIYILRKRK